MRSKHWGFRKPSTVQVAIENDYQQRHVGIMIRVQQEAFDTGVELQRLKAGAANIGGTVVFVGTVRDLSDGKSVSAMTLEHYPGMAEEEIARVAAEAEARWPLQGLVAIHRYGKIAPGENIVLVVTASSHRLAAFEAAQFLMDYLKTRAPFWKKEHRVDGSSGDWVEARDVDDRAMERWGRGADFFRKRADDARPEDLLPFLDNARNEPPPGDELDGAQGKV